MSEQQCVFSSDSSDRFIVRPERAVVSLENGIRIDFGTGEKSFTPESFRIVQQAAGLLALLDRI